MNKQEALLRNWRFIKSGGELMVIGDVYGHPRFPDGHRIHTSLVLKYNPKRDVVETLHTFYRLEDE